MAITEKEIIDALTEINLKAQFDPEAAHVLEDELHRNVLKAVGNKEIEDEYQIRYFCWLAMQSTLINFSRWAA